MHQSTSGWINGFLGVLIFSGSLPATRIAVADFDPVFLTVIRAAIAGVVAAALLVLLCAPKPSRRDFTSLVIVAIGVVAGFPLLTAQALQTITSAHATVFIGLLPLSTAIFGVMRGGERPRPAFWIFSGLGAVLVAGFALRHGGFRLSAGDLYMIAAIVVCGLGYAEGGKLARHLGGWQVISWALLVSLPVMLGLALMLWPVSMAAITLSGWASLAYVSLFSMLIGFVFWYRGLAQGGIAGVGQLQLLQPFMSLVWAALILHERVDPAMLLTTIAVVACVAGARKFSH